MKLQPELLDDQSPKGIEVYDIAPDADHALLTYPDQPTFLEGGRRLLMTVNHELHICHLDDNGRLENIQPLLPNCGKEKSHLSCDGRYLAYKADTQNLKDGNPAEKDYNHLLIRRYDFRTNKLEDIFSASGNLEGTDVPIGKFGIMTVSRDGLHVAGRIFLGDGKNPHPGWGIVVINTQTKTARVIQKHNDFHNTHLQYSRAHEAPAMYDLLVQMNHGAMTDLAGKIVKGLGPPSDLGVDVHVINDDGSNWRDLPFGRDGIEGNIGHQIWRGSTDSVVTVTLENLDTSYGWAEGTRQHVVAGTPTPADFNQPHVGRKGREGKRVELSKGFKDPRFCHLGVDDTGLRFSFDTFPIFNGQRAGMLIYIGQAKDMNSPLDFQYILNTGIVFTGGDKGTHAHPVLSPGGKELFFNSNMLGKPKAYMVKNLPWPD